MHKATIRINSERVIGQAHDHLYGANLEHLGQAIYGGVWAEMLVDRKFAGNDHMYSGANEGLHNTNPSVGIVFPWRAVNADRDAVLFAHDNTDFYTGRQSQRITIRVADSMPHGIMQGSLYLEAERDYALRLVVKGAGQALTVRLGEETWRIDALPDDWQTLNHTFAKAGHNPKGALNLTITEGSAWIGCASLMPTDNMEGFRADVIQAMRDWKPTQLRWPGGNFVSAYDWMAGIGDRDWRSAYLDPAWWQWEMNDMGTDEFVTLCRLVGAEPVLTINMGDRTVDDAAAWVEYCNGGADTKYGDMRARVGFPEPHNVRTWFVGNEQFGNWQVGHVDARTYARRYLEFAAAMRAVDPDLTLIGVGVPVDLYARWNEEVLSIAGAEMDQYSVHYYSIRTEKQADSPPPETVILPKLTAAHEVEGMLDATLAVMDQHSPKTLPLAFDEWNTYFSAKPPAFIEGYDMADAVYTASVMHLMLSRADRIRYSAIYHLVNVMGNYITSPLYEWDALNLGRGGGWVPASTGESPHKPATIKMPATLVLELLTRFRGADSLHTRVDCGTFSSPALGNQPAFDGVPLVNAAATHDRDARMLYVSLANCSPSEAVAVTLDGVDVKGEVELHIVAGESPLATNTFDAPHAVAIQSRRVPVDDIVLPPCSFAMLALPA